MHINQTSFLGPIPISFQNAVDYKGHNSLWMLPTMWLTITCMNIDHDKLLYVASLGRNKLESYTMHITLFLVHIFTWG